MLKTMIWILIFLLALSFFGISLQAIVNSPAGQANFSYLMDLITRFWEWLTQSTRSLLER